MRRLIYGIDPGFGYDAKTKQEKRRVGIAALDCNTGTIIDLLTVTFSDCVDLFRNINAEWLYKIIIEHPKTKRLWNGGGGSTSAVNIGMGLAAMSILAVLLERQHPGKIVRVYPHNTKLPHDDFCDRTGWTGGLCSQDARDAGMIAFDYWREYCVGGEK